MSGERRYSGPEMAALMRLGIVVKRGVDWCWGDEDGPGLGTVTEELDEDGWIKVTWKKNRRRMCYRMGYKGKYDLQLAEPEVSHTKQEDD